jgi:hypothetical protein
MKPRVCYNCGAPWKPKCDYCGTEYECDPPHDPTYLTMAQAQQQVQELSSLQLQSPGFAIDAAWRYGLLGALTGIKF